MCNHKSAGSADLVVAEQTPGRRKCSRCSSSVYGAHTLSLSGSPAPHRLALAASGVAVDTGHSSGAVWTGGGWGTRSPERQRKGQCPRYESYEQRFMEGSDNKTHVWFC